MFFATDLSFQRNGYKLVSNSSGAVILPKGGIESGWKEKTRQ